MARRNGMQEHLRKLKAVQKIDTNKALKRAADRIAQSAKDSIKPGPVSKPGEPPSYQIGDLEKGIISRTARDGADVVSTDEASATLEFGSSKRAARPFLRPAVEKNLKSISEEVAEEVRITIRRK